MQKSKLKIKNSGSGFTLIELIVVITLVGVLSALGYTTYTGIMAKSRDGQRKSDLMKIKSAVELYRSDQNGYPPDSNVSCSNPISAGSATYLQKVPCDPNGSGEYAYQYSQAGLGARFCLRACLENGDDPSKDDSINVVIGCSFTGTSCSKASYTIQSD